MASNSWLSEIMSLANLATSPDGSGITGYSLVFFSVLKEIPPRLIFLIPVGGTGAVFGFMVGMVLFVLLLVSRAWSWFFML